MINSPNWVSFDEPEPLTLLTKSEVHGLISIRFLQYSGSACTHIFLIKVETSLPSPHPGVCDKAVGITTQPRVSYYKDNMKVNSGAAP